MASASIGARAGRHVASGLPASGLPSNSKRFAGVSEHERVKGRLGAS